MLPVHLGCKNKRGLGAEREATGGGGWWWQTVPFAINWGESGEVGWCVADSLGCSWHADEVQSEMLGGFVPLAERKARQHILLTGFVWMVFQLACFWYKETTSPCVLSLPEIREFHRHPVTPNPGDLVEHSAAAIHLTFDINSARLFFDEQTDSQTIVKAILQQRPRPHSCVLLALRHPTV